MIRSFFIFRFSKKWMRLVFLILLFVWAFFLFSRYFLIPQREFSILTQAFSIPFGMSGPINAQWKSTCESFLKIIGTSMAVGFVTFRLGFFFRNWLGYRATNLLISWAVDFGLGVLLIDVLWLGLGFNQLWYGSLLRSCFGFLFLAFALEKILRFSVPSWKQIYIPDWPYGILGILGLIYWFFSCLHGFLPETHADGLNYHLGTPCYWLMQHGIKNFNTYYGGFPYGGELFLWTGYLLQGAESAKLLNVGVFGVCALAAAGWAQEGGGKNAAWLALGLTLTSPLLALVSWSTQIETFLVLFTILFFYGLYRLIKTNAFDAFGPDILLAGFWGGMALSVKYTAVLGIGMGLVLFPFFLKNVKRSSIKNFSILVFLLVGFDAIWFLKNWIFIANPMAPYFNNLFHDDSVSWWDKYTALDVNPEPMQWYRLVWTLVMSKPSLFGFAGPLVLLFLPGVFFFRTEKREWKWTGWILAVLCPVCLMFLTILKFHLPEIILFYIFCSVLYAGHENHGWGKAMAFLSFISGVLCFPYLAGMSSFYYSGWAVWTARENHDQYLERRLPYYGSCEFVSENLPQDSRLILIGPQNVYYDRFSNPDGEFFQRLFQTARSMDEVLLRVRQAGFTHIVIDLSNIGGANPFPIFLLAPAQWRLLDDYFRRGLEPIYEKGPAAIFRILPILKPKGDSSQVDPFLFCSWPASRFLEAKKAGDLEQAQFYLGQALELYSFSNYWKTQRRRLREYLKFKRPRASIFFKYPVTPGSPPFLPRVETNRLIYRNERRSLSHSNGESGRIKSFPSYLSCLHA